MVRVLFNHAQRIVDLQSCFKDQERAPKKQNQVPARNSVTENVEQIRSEANNPAQRQKQQYAHQQRKTKTNRPRAASLTLWQLVRRDRDKNNVVNA